MHSKDLHICSSGRRRAPRSSCKDDWACIAGPIIRLEVEHTHASLAVTPSRVRAAPMLLHNDYYTLRYGMQALLCGL